ncbi:hypothetical protein D3C77_484970 [compost metagenome]
MAEGRALGEAGGAGGVLDIDRLIELQALLTGLVVGQSGLPGQCRQPVPGQKAHRRRGIQADQPAQLRQPFAVQLPRLLPVKVGQQLSEHGVVVGGFECPGADQPLAT